MTSPLSLKLRIDGMDCASCALKIENAMKRLPGVSDIDVSYAGRSLSLRLDEDRTGVGAIERQVRALTPWPGCWFDAANGAANGERIKVLAAEPAAAQGTPGTLLDDRLTVACADGAVRLTKVQRPGKAPVDGAAFLRGFALAVGQPVSAEAVAD